MGRLAEGFDEAAARCTSLVGLRELVANISNELGFSHFALLHHASLGGEGTLVRLDNYPAEWVAELARGPWRQDPVHLACRRACGAFQWADAGRLVSLGSAQRAIFERGRHFGLGDGLTVPLNIPGEPAASCSFAVHSGRELPQRLLFEAEIIGIRAFRAARRLAAFPIRARPRLSPREVECVRWIAAGKTDWEIGRILDIGVETVRQYVKRARSAYGAVSRAQLVSLALRDEWLESPYLIRPGR